MKPFLRDARILISSPAPSPYMEKGFSAERNINDNVCGGDGRHSAEEEDEGLPKMNVKRHEESINLKVIPVLCVS